MNKIKEWREARGMTQLELAAAVDVSQAAVAKWETGVANPTAARLILIAQALCCSIGDLLSSDNGGSNLSPSA